MENVADSLKMAFAIFVFILALSIVLSLFTKVKTTADSILFNSDERNFHETISANPEEYKNGRKVNKETVLATIKKGEVYVRIINGNDVKEISPSQRITKDIIEDIEGEYYETISDITTSGKYSKGEDGVKVAITQGETRTYATYTKIN